MIRLLAAGFGFLTALMILLQALWGLVAYLSFPATMDPAFVSAYVEEYIYEMLVPSLVAVGLLIVSGLLAFTRSPSSLWSLLGLMCVAFFVIIGSHIYWKLTTQSPAPYFYIHETTGQFLLVSLTFILLHIFIPGCIVLCLVSLLLPKEYYSGTIPPAQSNNSGNAAGGSVSDEY